MEKWGQVASDVVGQFIEKEWYLIEIRSNKESEVIQHKIKLYFWHSL